MNTTSEIIRLRHASNVAAQHNGGAGAYGGPEVNYSNNSLNFKQLLRMSRKGSANLGARLSLG